MEFNAFTAGIEPGGLRNTDEIRILLCYLLSSVNAPLRKEDIIRILQETGLANYFETANALSELSAKGNIRIDQDGLCRAEETAKLIAGQLDTMLPVSVRDRVVSAALNLLAMAKRERENKVEIEKTQQGYYVTCHVSGGEMELMSFSLYVPDLHQAKMVKHNFHRDPEGFYRSMLALSTGNRDIVNELLERFPK